MGLASAVVGLACFAVPASASPSWLAPVKLSAAPYEALTPQIAGDAQGDDLAVWSRYEAKAGHSVIEAAARPAGGVWQSPVVISNPTEDSSLPQVALDSSGDALAVWLAYDGSEYSIQTAASAGISGPWGQPETLEAIGTMPVPRPDLAVNSHGDAVAAWEANTGAQVILEASIRTAVAWEAPETISKKAVDLHPPEVGIDAAGDTTAAWEQEVEGSIRAAVSTRRAGGKWHNALALSRTGGNANEVRLAENASGEAAVIWERFEGEELIEASGRASATGSWSEPVKLSRTEAGKGEPGEQQLALDDHGDAVAVWSRLQGTEDVVEAALGAVATASWSAPATISGKGRNIEEAPEVGVDESGDAVVVWPQWNGEAEVIEGVSGNAPNATWGAPVQLSASGEEAGQAGVALDSQGDAAAVWLRVNETSKVMLAEAAGYDAAGPELNALTVPADGTVGQTLSFSVSPFDVWSELGTTTWSFGDGGQASGTSVSHSYAAAGTYTVAVTSLDALGNPSSEQATISITAPLITCAEPGGALGTGDPCPPPLRTPPPPGHGPILCAASGRAPAVESACVTPGQPPPRITSARLTHERFRVSKRATAVLAKTRPPTGTTFHVALSEAAAVKIAFQHQVGGLRSAGRCVAPSAKLRRKHARHCSRTVTVGALDRAHEAKGPDSIPFSGRLGTKPLRPGAYRAIVTARAGGRTSTPVRLAFTVLA